MKTHVLYLTFYIIIYILYIHYIKQTNTKVNCTIIYTIINAFLSMLIGKACNLLCGTFVQSGFAFQEQDQTIKM